MTVKADYIEYKLKRADDENEVPEYLKSVKEFIKKAKENSKP